MSTRDNAGKNVIFFDDHSGHHPRCKNLWSFSLFSSNYFPWLYCVDFSGASFISIVLCHSSSSETQGHLVGARKSLNGRNRSLLFFASYFSARLDFPPPPLLHLPLGSRGWSLVSQSTGCYTEYEPIIPSRWRFVQSFKSWPIKLELKRKDPCTCCKFRERQ